MKPAKLTLLIVVTFLFVATIQSCSTDEHKRVRRVAKDCYELLQKGKYEKFVGEIVYADSMSEDYRGQMVDLIKEFAMSQQVQHGKLVSIEAVGDTLTDSLAHVYLQLSYADSTSEEVGVPMIKVGKCWKMQ